jgi:hypothetical protein
MVVAPVRRNSQLARAVVVSVAGADADVSVSRSMLLSVWQLTKYGQPSAPRRSSQFDTQFPVKRHVIKALESATLSVGSLCAFCNFCLIPTSQY